MTIKLGSSTEINTVAIIEPYGDDLKVVPDESSGPWVRPSHWLDMPVINSGEQKCAILYAVPSGNSVDNFFQISARGNFQGNIHTDFTIDWGDGNTHTCNEYHSQHASPPALTANHVFDFDSLPVSTQFEHNGTPYRQSLIVFDAPNSGIDTFLYNYSQSYPGGSKLTIVNYLDIDINLPSGISIGGNYYGTSTKPLLERARIHSPKTTDLQNYLANAPRLRSVEFGPFDNMTTCRGLFYGCSSLDYVPELDTSNSQYMENIFNGTNIRSYNNNYDLSSATHIDGLFANCRNLKTIHIDLGANIHRMYNFAQNSRNLVAVSGDWNMPNLVYGNYMFQNCESLARVPDMSITGVQQMSFAFNNCRVLQKTPRINFPALTHGEHAFAGCYNLKKITIEDLSNPNMYRIDHMFNSCVSAREVKILNPNIQSSYNGIYYSFANMYNLEHIDPINASGNHTLDGMFSYCYKLKSVGPIQTPDTTIFQNMFYNCYELEESPVTSISAGGSGEVNCMRMFYNCNSLKNINFDFSRVYNAREMFFNCYSVTGVIDVLDMSMNNNSNTSDYQQTFQNCSIEKINHMIIPSGATMYYTFYNSKIKSIPFVSASGATYLTNTFHQTRYLDQGALSGIQESIGYYRTNMPSGEIYKLFDNLASGVTNKTIDLREAPQAYILHSDTIAIATSKGWTVTT